MLARSFRQAAVIGAGLVVGPGTPCRHYPQGAQTKADANAFEDLSSDIGEISPLHLAFVRPPSWSHPRGVAEGVNLPKLETRSVIVAWGTVSRTLLPPTLRKAAGSKFQVVLIPFRTCTHWPGVQAFLEFAYACPVCVA